MFSRDSVDAQISDAFGNPKNILMSLHDIADTTVIRKKTYNSSRSYHVPVYTIHRTNTS